MKKDFSILIGGIFINLFISSASSCGSSTEETCHYCEDDVYLMQHGQVVIDDTEEVWSKIFSEQYNKNYDPAELAFFNKQISTPCSKDISFPHYCRINNTVYMDLNFIKNMDYSLDIDGVFFYEYIIAHEVGHRIQDQLGIVNSVMLERGNRSEEEYYEFLKRLELQADFLAGIWAHNSNLKLNVDQIFTSDLKQIMELQNMISSYDTHGSPQQRMDWFLKGYETGDLEQGNTFVVEEL